MSSQSMSSTGATASPRRSAATSASSVRTGSEVLNAASRRR
uniref:ACO31 n=1 Tax=Arundo donax TaxID=35708 RepID=A0A0A9BHM1_ARUDO